MKIWQTQAASYMPREIHHNPFHNYYAVFYKPFIERLIFYFLLLTYIFIKLFYRLILTSASVDLIDRR